MSFFKEPSSGRPRAQSFLPPTLAKKTNSPPKGCFLSKNGVLSTLSLIYRMFLGKTLLYIRYAAAWCVSVRYDGMSLATPIYLAYPFFSINAVQYSSAVFQNRA